MLYVATAHGLPVSESPQLSVQPVRPALKAVTRWFRYPHVRFVGAHTGCSCGFPSVMTDEPVEYYDGMFDASDDERQKAVASVNALFQLIQHALQDAPDIELFAVWAGDEDESPAGTIELEFEALDPEQFFFNEHYFYRIRRRGAA